MIYDNLLSIAARAPATSGLKYEGRLEPYAALVERVGRLAGGFAARGIEPGDAVAILLKNSPDLFVVVHALFALGAIAMPLGLTTTRGEAATVLRKAAVSALVAGLEHREVASQIAEDLGGAKPLPIVVVGDSGDWSLRTLERTPIASLSTPPANTPALYLLSSGSTGLPKVVPHTHGGLLADARRTSTAWQLTPEDRVFDMLPGNFAMGLLLGAIDAAQVGATTVYWSDPRPLVLARGALLEVLINERITMMGAVPAMYDALAGVGGNERLPHMRLAFSGGAALKRETFERVRERFGITLTQDYGSTEALMVSHNNADDPDRLWDSVGKPAGDAEVRLAPMDTGLGPDVGELMVKSSSMTAGYLGEQALNASAFPDGWLMTGDLARLDDEGNIFIKGRSKLLIEVSGFKVDPLEVEDVLHQHPALTEAAVVGVREGRNREQRLKAFVVRRHDVSPDDLQRYLRERLAVHKVPTLIEFREQLPRSAAGKLLRARLSERES